jgi:type II secretory pathway pseudopilin PulG
VVVIVGVVAVLAALLFVLLLSPSEQTRRTRCRANLQQLGRALQLYAADYNNLLPDCTPQNPRFFGSHWPWDLNTNLVAELERRGASRKVFYCPSNREMDNDQRWKFYQYAGVPIRVVGYVFLVKGCTQIPPKLWRTSLAGDGTTPPAETELVVDATVSRNGDYAHIQGKWVDRSSHLGKGGRPEGGNILFEDGHAAWRDFGQMRHQIFGDAVWDF